MAMTIRPATLSDWDHVVDFNVRLAWESEEKKLDVELLRAGVKNVLLDPGKSRYFLAETEHGVVGQCALTYEWSDWRNGWFWWIQSVYVVPEARKQGIFRALFEHVHNAARADSCVIGLRLLVEKENVSAQQVYAKLGMTWTDYWVKERYPL
jgi:GNAT superfamily N-acetyltransferase